MLENESKDITLEKNLQVVDKKLEKAKHRRRLIAIAVVIVLLIISFLYLIGYVIYSSPSY